MLFENIDRAKELSDRLKILQTMLGKLFLKGKFPNVQLTFGHPASDGNEANSSFTMGKNWLIKAARLEMMAILSELSAIGVKPTYATIEASSHLLEVEVSGDGSGLQIGGNGSGHPGNVG